jgi:hypothetical protein
MQRADVRPLFRGTIGALHLDNDLKELIKSMRSGILYLDNKQFNCLATRYFSRASPMVSSHTVTTSVLYMLHMTIRV